MSGRGIVVPLLVAAIVAASGWAAAFGGVAPVNEGTRASASPGEAASHATPRARRVRLTRQRNGLLTAGRRRHRGERVRLRLRRTPPRRTAAQRARLARAFAGVNPPAAPNPVESVGPPDGRTLADAPTSAGEAALGAQRHGHDGFVEFRDRSVIGGTQDATAQTNIVAEPSIANDRDAVLVVGNHFAALSTDNGLDFRYLDPFATFKPPGDTTTPGIFSADQVALAEDLGGYSLVFWLLQGSDNGNENAVRLVVFRGRDELAGASGTTSVCSYVFRPRDFGLADKRKLDFPQMATTDRFLYLTINEVKIKRGTNQTKNGVIWRMGLDDLDTAACDADIDRSWVEPTAKTLAPVQGAGSEMFFATHHWELGSGDMLRIYRVADGSSSLTRVDRNIDNFPEFTKRQDCELTRGGGGDPCARKGDARITTGVRKAGTVAWLWTAAQGSGYKYPHVRTATFSTPSLVLLDETTIYNDDYAWVHPSAAINARGEIGVVLYRMGGSQLPEARGYIAPSLSALLPDHTNSLRISQHGVAEDQWGDYTTVRAQGNCANSFISPVQAMADGRTDDDVEVRAVFFGEEGDGCADLTVTDVGWSGGGSAQTLLVRALDRLKVTPVTRNIGTADVTDQSRTAVYISDDKRLSDDDVLLSPTHFIPDLGATASAKRTLDVKIPRGTALGAYHLLACADHKEKVAEITDLNNCWASPSASLQVVAGLGGIEEHTDVRLAGLASPTRSAAAGAGVTVSLALRGQRVDASRLARTGVRYLLTPDPASGQEIPLRARTLQARTGAASGGPQRTLTSRVTLPGRLGAGRWYLRACLRHPRRTVDQRRFNDCRTSPRAIDVR